MFFSGLRCGVFRVVRFAFVGGFFLGGTVSLRPPFRVFVALFHPYTRETAQRSPSKGLWSAAKQPVKGGVLESVKQGSKPRLPKNSRPGEDYLNQTVGTLPLTRADKASKTSSIFSSRTMSLFGFRPSSLATFLKARHCSLGTGTLTRTFSFSVSFMAPKVLPLCFLPAPSQLKKFRVSRSIIRCIIRCIWDANWDALSHALPPLKNSVRVLQTPYLVLHFPALS